jgi:hypothetical protein
MKTHGPLSLEQKRARDALDASLARPARSHADQIAELRAAIANTHPDAAPLGLLLWPGETPIAACGMIFSLHHARFQVAYGDGRKKSWRHLYAAGPERLVFDPCGLSREAGAFGRLVQSRRFETILLGIEACRAATSPEAILNHARAL